MCQLLALTSNAPTDISFSFEGFINRAGITDTNVDGTGIAFFEEGNNVRVLKDERRGVDSYVRNLVKLYQIKSTHVIAHIRRASQGNAQLINCHPFVREIWGESWVFAHNGHIMNYPGMDPSIKDKVVGETDSELFFAYLCDRLEKKFSEKPSCEAVFTELCQLCDEYSEAGIINFVLSNGSCLIAHCSTNLYWVSRNAKEDNLIKRIDDGGVINLSAYAQDEDKVAIICTMPITYEKWNKMENGQMHLFRNGELKLTYNGIPNVIDEKYAALTGLSTEVQEKVEEEQKQFAQEELLSALAPNPEVQELLKDTLEAAEEGKALGSKKSIKALCGCEG